MLRASSPRDGKLRLSLKTKPPAPRDRVTFFLFRHGHRHTLGRATTNARGRLVKTFRVKHGHYKVQARTAATATLQRGQSKRVTVTVH